METSTRTAFRAARIVAAALSAAPTLGMAYLHFRTGDGTVSVPPGAHAGQLTLHGCRSSTEDGSYAADCGTLVVPENRHDPHSRLIALPIRRIRSRAAHPGAPIFRLQGGPGISNMTFEEASRFAGSHDVVLIGYRGIDGSSRLDCREVVSARAHARDLLSDSTNRAVASALRACARRLQDDGVDLAGYTLVERVDDLEAARRAFGYPQVDLVSESMGTRLAMIYAWRYPKRIHRSVMIGVNPPGHFLWDAATTGEQIRRYAALCRADADCRSRTPDLAASLHSAFAHIPGHWLFLRVEKGNVRAAAFFGLMNATADGGGPLSGPRTIDTLLSAGQGDGSGAWFLSLMAQIAFPAAQVWGDVASMGRSDWGYARPFFASRKDRGSLIGAPGNDLVWAGGRLVGAWPASPDDRLYGRVRDSKVETLLVGGALDFATPPQNAARELLPHLRNGREVVLRNLGHTDDFWTYEPKASSRLVETYVDTGRVDTSLYTPNRLDFSPSVSHGAIAKIVLAVLLSFGGLTVLSLLWMPLRVRRRGAFGRKGGPVVRSAYAILLGIGGWFVGVLVALAALPTVALDDPVLAGVSIGLPVGLAAYFGWVRRDWSCDTKTIGLAAAAGGALVGAWLGFHALDGLFAVVTTALGAVVGGNVLLLALDVAWDLQARDRFAAETPGEAVVTIG
jgi:pimeloyl-ACP methyl ester carboxylesterase